MADTTDETAENAPGDEAPVGPDRRAPKFISVGRIARPHGVLGEVQVDVYTDFPEDRFAPGTSVWIGRDEGDEPVSASISFVRPHRDRLLVTFEGHAGREAAERLRGLYVLAPSSSAHQLAEDEFYAHQLIGLDVVTRDGDQVGEVTGLFDTGATDVLRIMGERELMVPLSRTIVVEVDLDGGKIIIDPPDGLI